MSTARADYQLELGDQIDFNDMINKAEDYIRTSKYQSNFGYVLVDEFQDISYSRYSLLKSLLARANPHSKSFCVRTHRGFQRNLARMRNVFAFEDGYVFNERH